MLDTDLTIEGGLQEIGEIIQSGEVTITADSPYTEALKAFRLRIAELYKQELICFVFGGYLFGGIYLREGVFEDSPEKRSQLHCELYRLCDAINTEFIRAAFKLAPIPDAYPAEYLSFTDPLREAIDNAVDHGTNFCTQGNVEFQIKLGRKGILGVVSQESPGLTSEQIEKALTCERDELIRGTELTGIRGMGLLCYRHEENARVGFDLYTEDSPIFRIIVLETRKRLYEEGLIRKGIITSHNG